MTYPFKRDPKLPLVRRDWSSQDMDSLSLATCRTFPPTAVIWHGRHCMSLKDYLDLRVERYKIETGR